MNTEHLSLAKRQLVKSALIAGYTATQAALAGRAIFLFKGKTTQSRGVIIWENGMITRADVRLDLATAMTIADTKKHLALS